MSLKLFQKLCALALVLVQAAGHADVVTDTHSAQLHKKVESYGSLTGWFGHVVKTVPYDVKDMMIPNYIEQTYVSLIYTDHYAIGGSGTAQASIVVSYPRKQHYANFLESPTEQNLELLLENIFILPEPSSAHANQNLPKIVEDIRVVNGNLILDAKLHKDGDASNFPSMRRTYNARYANGKWQLD